MADSSREPGAPLASGFVPLCVPCIRGNEWAYVKECLDSNWVSSAGKFVERFEAMMISRLNVKYAVATVSGTAALHVALHVAGIQPDDEVVVSDLTFIAPANAIRYVGAWPVFIDAESEYWQMDPYKLRDFLENDCVSTPKGLRNRRTGRMVRALLPAHILGHPCDMAPIRALADEHGLVVIEDATESLGAIYYGKPVGTHGQIACFSFNGNKIVTTGGGGMIVTDNDAWAQRARYLTTQAKDNPVEFVHETIGYNYRLANILAAMGCAQMESLDGFVAEKRATAMHYSQALADIPGIITPRESSGVISTFWLYTILVDERRYGIDSRALLRYLDQRGIQSRPLWQPMHRSPAHAGSYHTDCSVSDSLNRDALSLPCSVGLSSKDRNAVIAAITSVGGWDQR